MTSLDGEYMLLGRKTQDTANIFVQYGQGETRTVNVTGGNGVQTAEFIDGLRFSVMSGKPFRMNVDIPYFIDQTVLPSGSKSLSKSCVQQSGASASCLNSFMPTSGGFFQHNQHSYHVIRQADYNRLIRLDHQHDSYCGRHDSCDCAIPL